MKCSTNAMPWQKMMSGHCDQGQIRRWPERRCARACLGDMECSFLWRAIASERPLAKRYFFATDGASVNLGQPAPVAGRELSSR